MTGNRRELPPSKVAGHRWGLVPHRGCEGSPCGWTHPLLEVERLDRSESPEWLVGGDRPNEARELAGAGDDDLLVWLAARRHPLPALEEPLLAAPGAFDDERVLAALAAGELVADLRRRRACQADSTSRRRTWLLPTFVIEPCRRRSPEECSDGTKPTKAMNSSAVRKRLKSPISATGASAVRVSIPRRQRSLATSSLHGPCSAVSRIARSSISIRRSTRSTACR